MRRIALATALLASMGLAAPVLADDDRGRLRVPTAEWKPAAEIKDKLTADGYTVREIDVDDGAYEVEVTDKDGVRMEFHVHPATGQVLQGYDD